MKVLSAVAFVVLAAVVPVFSAPTALPPKAGKVEIKKASVWGPDHDIIVGKIGGKAKETNVAVGMSGSPVYVNGKLIGAVALRLSVFSLDAICGITPIELMLEINDLDRTRPMGARAPAKSASVEKASVSMPSMVPGSMVQTDTPSPSPA